MHYLAILFTGILAFIIPHHQVPIPEPTPIVVQATTTAPAAPVEAPKKAVSSAPIVSNKPDTKAQDIAALQAQVDALEKLSPQPQPIPVSSYDYAAQQQQREQDSINQWIAQTRAPIDAYAACQSQKAQVEETIRAQVQAGGGFATNSQIEAMASKQINCQI